MNLSRPQQAAESTPQAPETIENPQLREFHNARDALRNVDRQDRVLENHKARATNLVNTYASEQIHTVNGEMSLREYMARSNPSLAMSSSDLGTLIGRAVAISGVESAQSNEYNESKALVENLRDSQQRFNDMFGQDQPRATRELQDVHRERLSSDNVSFLEGINRDNDTLTRNLRNMQTLLNNFEQTLEEARESATTDLLERQIDDQRELDNASRQSIASATRIERAVTSGSNETPWEQFRNKNLDGSTGVVTASRLNIRDLDGKQVGQLENGQLVALEGQPVEMVLNGRDMLMGRIKGSNEQYVALGFLNPNRNTQGSPSSPERPIRPDENDLIADSTPPSGREAPGTMI